MFYNILTTSINNTHIKRKNANTICSSETISLRIFSQHSYSRLCKCSPHWAKPLGSRLLWLDISTLCSNTQCSSSDLYTLNTPTRGYVSVAPHWAQPLGSRLLQLDISTLCSSTQCSSSDLYTLGTRTQDYVSVAPIEPSHWTPACCGLTYQPFAPAISTLLLETM
jgi:hypothetical protein